MNPSESQNDTFDNEEFTGKYKQSGIAKLLIDNYFKSVTRLVRAIPKGVSNALEVGCAEGHSTYRIHEILGSEIHFEASEFLARQVEFARNNNPRISIIQESVYDLQRAAQTKDLVFLLEVLEHLDHPIKALEELARVGEFLILGVPREPIWRVLNMVRGSYLTDFGNTPGHINHWSTGGIQKLIEQHFGPVLAVEKPLPWTIVLAKSRYAN